jgi:hypothetical protein
MMYACSYRIRMCVVVYIPSSPLYLLDMMHLCPVLLLYILASRLYTSISSI